MMDSFVVGMVTLLGLVGMGGHPGGFGRLTPVQVHDLLGRPGVVIIDNNPEELYLEGHVPGAIHLNAAHYAASDLPADKSLTLIFYCHNER